MRVEKIIAACLFLATAPCIGDDEIERIELRFESDRLTRVVDRDAELTVHALIAHNRTTFLRGAWEVASPPGTMGEPLFVPVELIQEMLSGAGETSIASPVLPTRDPGAYLVRLRVDQPRLSRKPEVLRYQVIGD